MLPSPAPGESPQDRTGDLLHAKPHVYAAAISCSQRVFAASEEITDTEAQEQLEVLGARRLVSRVALNSQLPAAYRITRTAAQQIDPALPPLRPLDPGQYRHEIGIAWLTAAARTGSLGEMRDVLTRRQMHAADTTGRSAKLLDTPAATFKDEPVPGAWLDARRAYPDLGLLPADGGGGWATVLIILQAPDPHRLQTLLRRSHRDRLLRAQFFLVEQDQEIDILINTAAAELGLTDYVHVQRLAPGGLAGA